MLVLISRRDAPCAIALACARSARSRPDGPRSSPRRQVVLARAVLDEAVRHADTAGPAGVLRALQCSSTAEPAPPATTFSSIVTTRGASRRSRRQRFVQRLHEAHVDERRVERSAAAAAGFDHRAEAAGRGRCRRAARLRAADGSARIVFSTATPGPAPRG
jgi:hypothetical protein